MRNLFCTIPAFGHLCPLLPLAEAARRAGHDVHFATAGEFVDRLRLAGFPTATSARASTRPTGSSAASPAGRACRGTPPGGPTSTSAALCHLVSPILPDEIHARILGDRLIDIFADTLQPVAPPPVGWVRMRPTPLQRTRCRRARMARALRSRPLTNVTLGTIVAHDDLLRPLIEGVAALDTDVLVALGGADGTSLGALPDNVHVERFVDQSTVLRHARVAVHHGGSGTMPAAAAAGVAQVVLPKGADQFFNGDILRASGVALGALLDLVDAISRRRAA